MFNKNFYPTPKELIRKMVYPLFEGIDYWKRRELHVLEPSAGKGDILDYLKNSHDMKNLYAIEIEPDLRSVLQGKAYRVIDSDFLQYSGRYHFDAIVMNPPFDNGVDHLLKAWDTLQTGKIVCLLNAENIRNPYSEKRKLVTRLIEEHGSVEYVADAFKTAERKTSIEVAIVRLEKKGMEGIAFDHSGFDFDHAKTEQEFKANPLASANMIDSLVHQYQCAEALLVEESAVYQKFLFYTKGIHSVSLDEGKVKGLSLNEKINKLKAEFWDYIFTKTELGSRTTTNFRKKFDEFATQTAQLAFNKANIMSVLEMFFLNQESIMLQCICEVFDMATRFHEKNTAHTEGWKSNKSWKINKKIVVPNAVRFEYGFWSINHLWRSIREFLTDLDKACCFLTNKKPNEIVTIEKALELHFGAIRNYVNKGKSYDEPEREYDDKFESEFFTIRMFKKGTVHLEFKSQDLLNTFNIKATQGKGNLVGAGY